jgi:hypothetical protein
MLVIARQAFNRSGSFEICAFCWSLSASFFRFYQAVLAKLQQKLIRRQLCAALQALFTVIQLFIQRLGAIFWR